MKSADCIMVQIMNHTKAFISFLFFVFLISGCTGEECEVSDDCFQHEYCHDGLCLSGSNGNYGSNGGQSQSCTADQSCDRGVPEEVTSIVGLRLNPQFEDGEEDRYGCIGDGDDAYFAGTEGLTLRGNTCFDDVHRFRVQARTCRQVDFYVQLELVPRNDSCNVRDEANVVFHSNLANHGECATATSTECYETHDTPDHGGYKWTVRLFNVFSADPTVPIDVIIYPEDGYSVPYDLIVDVLEI